MMCNNLLYLVFKFKHLIFEIEPFKVKKQQKGFQPLHIMLGNILD